MANTEKFIDLTGLGEFKSKMDLSVDGKVGVVSEKIGTVPEGSTVVGMIGTKADASTTYTKTEVDTAIGAKADSATTVAGYGITDAYTKTEVDTAVNAKADAATTVAGYGITDAYTKTEVDTAIATAVSGASHLEKEIVTTLPTAAEAEENVIYMVKDTSVSSGDAYKEYMLINDAVVQIGDTTTDLTNYAQTSVTDALDSRIDDLEAASLTVATTQEIDALFA